MGREEWGRAPMCGLLETLLLLTSSLLSWGGLLDWKGKESGRRESLGECERSGAGAGGKVWGFDDGLGQGQAGRGADEEKEKGSRGVCERSGADAGED
mmetsp:Transcript_19795/g.55225  ORF Transcript_19795/g.55225 Transcript_19795/m.55225 type:complete len:98 (-) Transcript_19795:791-1084(-)